MKNNILVRSISTALTICPWDCLLMSVVQLSITLLPTFVLLINQRFIFELGNMQDINAICLILIAYCAALLLQHFLNNWFNHYYLTYISLLNFEKKIKIILFDICNRMKLSDYNVPQIENATIRAKNASINILRVYQAAGEMISALVGAFFMSYILSSISRSMAIIVFLLICSSIIENLYIMIQNKKLLYQNTQLEKESEELESFLVEPQKIKEIRSLDCAEFIFLNLAEVMSSLKRSERKKDIKVFLFSLIFGTISIICQIIAYGILFTSFIDQKIGFAEFSVSITAFNSLNGLIKNMFEILGGIGQFLVMVAPFFEFKDSVEKKGKIPVNEKHFNKSLRLEHVYYCYPGMSENALNDINMHIDIGNKIAIVGENGSGKTTLINLILSMLNPTDGLIMYDGISSECLNEENVVYNISVIPQEFNCYAISIKDNITFGIPSEEKKIDEYLTYMNLDELKTNREAIIGLDFGGIELSGGEKQRLAIARAKFKNATFFILDEPTSAIDPFQEKEIYRRLLDMIKGKTAIIISHRLALTKSCDQIYVLKKGNIVEKGIHSELIKINGIYAEMWRAQAGIYF